VRKFALISDIAGLFTVVASTGLAVLGLTYFGIFSAPWIAEIIAAPILVGATLYAWYVSEGGRRADTETWMMGTIFTPLFGAMSFAIDVFTGSTTGHYSNFVQAAFHAGSPFGILLTVMICPIATIICAGSWVRRSLLDRFFPKSEGSD
jgi:hypothetical protein